MNISRKINCGDGRVVSNCKLFHPFFKNCYGSTPVHARGPFIANLSEVSFIFTFQESCEFRVLLV